MMSNYSISTFKPVSLISSSTSLISLSGDAAVEQLLSDIPNFSVGIMAFGVSTFWLFMRKRVSLLATLIYLATLLSFIAGIFDLVQILARGPANIDRGTGIDTPITVLMDIREVLLSLARGAIFLFFWSFIAEKPRGEPPPNPMFDINVLAYGPREDIHSASWKRWGILGWLLQNGLFLASISVPVLQIIWRIIDNNTIYMVESTIEIIVTGLFLLKVFLNIFLSPLTPWWRPFKFYLVPILALLLNLALAIGNLISFRFTDSTLGRFLQAVELYILILFIMIDAFYKVPIRPPRSRRSKGNSSFITQKPRDFSLPPPVLMGGEDAKGPTGPYFTANVNAPMTRNSVISRLSSLVPRRSISVLDNTNVVRQTDRDTKTLDPYSVYEVPRGESPDQPVKVELSPQPEPTKSPNVVTAPPPQIEPIPSPIPVPIPASDPVPTSPPNLNPPLAVVTNIPPSPTTEIDNRESRPSTGYSFSYYGIERANPPFMEAASRQDTPSPIYGLNGIINAPMPNQRNSAVSLGNRQSGNSFEELLRQQTELDKSIAALRLFSPQSNTTEFRDSVLGPEVLLRSSVNAPQVVSSSPPTRPALSSGNTSSERIRSNTTHSSQKHDSASEFSLSIFPEPPAEGSLTPTRVASFAALRSRRSSARRAPFDQPPSLPTSPNRVGARSDKFGSAGTQYDVTSFIGNLTSPVGGLRPGSAFRPVAGLSDVESEDEGSTSFVQQSARPIVLESAVPVISTISSSNDDRSQPEPPATASSGISPSPTREYPVLKPFLLGNITTYPTVSSPLASSSRVVGPRRPARGRLALPSQPRPVISAPRPRESESEGDLLRYERPRKPPILNLSVDSAPS